MLQLNMCQAANSLESGISFLLYPRKQESVESLTIFKFTVTHSRDKNFPYHSTDISLHYTSLHVAALLTNLAALSLPLSFGSSPQILSNAMTVKKFEFSPLDWTHIRCETMMFSHCVFWYLATLQKSVAMVRSEHLETKGHCSCQLTRINFLKKNAQDEELKMATRMHFCLAKFLPYSSGY